jgi:hypothetical protein
LIPICSKAIAASILALLTDTPAYLQLTGNKKGS